ncbi:MAG: SDR family NAD(P)-dependent oxidoreductase, partial [Dongiaceae bacterium]
MTIALVTGGSQGIGFAIAKALLDFHETVLLVARSEEKLKTAAVQLEQA